MAKQKTRKTPAIETLQIGSPPWAILYSSMKEIICGMGGRAPPGQNTQTPSSGSRWPGAVL